MRGLCGRLTTCDPLDGAKPWRFSWLLGATIAACGDEGNKLSAPTFTVDLTATTQVATSPPSSGDAPPTSSPATSSSAAAPSTAPTSTGPNTTVALTTAALATTTSTTVPATPTPTDGVAVTYAGGTGEYASYIIAVWTGTEWANPSWNDDGTPSDVGSATALATTALGLGDPIVGTTFGELDYFCYQDDLAPRLILPPGASTGQDFDLTVTADWDIQPRPATPAPEPAVFAESGYTMVDGSESAFAAEGVVSQAVDADLDGDGFAEAIYTFERHSDDVDGFGSEGDFSLVVAMYPDDDGVVRHHVLFELYEHPDFQPGDIDAEVSAVADVNGDGVMEVVVSWTYWESDVVDVYAFDGSGELVNVAGGGCGS